MGFALGERGRAAVDVAVALAAALFTLVMLLEGGLGTAGEPFRQLDLAGVVLALASSVPLISSRHTPGTSFGICAVATLTLIGFDYAMDVPPGMLVATYLLADALGGGDMPVERRWAAACVAAFLPAVFVLMALNDKSVLSMSSGLVAWTTMFALLWTTGDRNRLRRDRISELTVLARLQNLEIESARRVVAAEERTRIARELHDSAGHAINVILVQAGAARLLHDRDPERSLRAVQTIEDVAHATIADIDRIVRALRDDSRLTHPAPTGTAALEQLVDRHRAGGLEVSATFEGAPRKLPSGVAWAAYRILQEALTNAARHGSGQAEVRMSYGSSAVEIMVSNPVGEEKWPGGGLGIVGMRERAALLDGTCEAGAEESGRFRLWARLPYAPPVVALRSTAIE